MTEALQERPAVRSAGEQDAELNELFARYAKPLQRFCLRELGNVQEAEDAVQTTFLNAFRAFRRGVRPELEVAWLYAIASNVCRSRRRSFFRRRRVECDDDLHALADVLAAPPRFEAEALIGLGDALASMPENQRSAILLREWQGLSYAEIAKEMGLSHSAVETLIFRARRTLAKGLEREQSGGRHVVGGINLGSLLAGLKGLFAGAGAVKLAAAGAVVVAAGVAVPLAQHATPAPKGPVDARPSPPGAAQPPVLVSVPREAMLHRAPPAPNAHRLSKPQRAANEKAAPGTKGADSASPNASDRVANDAHGKPATTPAKGHVPTPKARGATPVKKTAKKPLKHTTRSPKAQASKTTSANAAPVAAGKESAPGQQKADPQKDDPGQADTRGNGHSSR